MKQFIEKNFTIIVFVLLIFTFFKGCNDSRELTKVKNELSSLRDSVATKAEIRALDTKTEDLKNSIWGFMDSQNFIMNNFIDQNVKKKASDEAMSIYTNKIKELNLNKK